MNASRIQWAICLMILVFPLLIALTFTLAVKIHYDYTLVKVERDYYKVQMIEFCGLATIQKDILIQNGIDGLKQVMAGLKDCDTYVLNRSKGR